MSALLYYHRTFGLQVLTKQGEWLIFPLLENTLVMNIGDMMEILSNMQIFSHQTSGQKSNRTLSPFLYFFCDYDYVIQPINTNEPPKYTPLARWRTFV